MFISYFNIIGTFGLLIHSHLSQKINETIIIIFSLISLVWIYDDQRTLSWINNLTQFPFQKLLFSKYQTSNQYNKKTSKKAFKKNR